MKATEWVSPRTEQGGQSFKCLTGNCCVLYIRHHYRLVCASPRKCSARSVLGLSKMEVLLISYRKQECVSPRTGFKESKMKLLFTFYEKILEREQSSFSHQWLEYLSWTFYFLCRRYYRKVNRLHEESAFEGLSVHLLSIQSKKLMVD